MVHIDRLVLRNFRGIVRGEVELAPLTILVGPNNSGKTTILEALALAHGFRPIFGNYDIQNILSYIHRTYASESLDHLVYSYGARVSRALIAFRTREGVARAIVIDVHRDHLDFYLVDKPVNLEELLTIDREELRRSAGGKEIAHVHRFRGGGTFSPIKVLADVVIVRYDLVHRFQDFLYSVWTDIANRGITSRVAEWVSQIAGEKYIDILAEPFGGKPTLYLYRGDRARVRVGDVGDGVKMLVLSRAVVEYVDPEIVLWDDVEAHMNPRALQLLALWLAELVDGGRQVVVTSHSLEAVTTIAELCDKATIVRLALENGELKTEYLSVEDVEKLKSLGIDVRA